MDPIKDINRFQEELLEIVNGQIAHRRYMLNELVGSLYPSILQAELEKLETLKGHILELGETK